jgi:hypothetical protein
MSESDANEATPPPDDSAGGEPVQQIRHQQISARVPESVARGVFSTGAIVLVGHNEFIIDFVLRMTRPHQVAARVVMPHAVMPQFIKALQENVSKFEDRFGKPTELPRPPSDHRPNIQEIYDEMKLPDEILCGAYANGVMVGHSASEFSFDFITSFFPRSSVSCRVFLSAPQVPRLLESLEKTFANFQQRVEKLKGQRQSQDPAAPPATPPPRPPNGAADEPLDPPSRDANDPESS